MDDALVDHGTVDEGGMTYPSLTFLQRIPSTDLTYAPQQSTDLAGWNEGAAHLVEHSAIDQGDGTYLVTVRSLTPVSGAEKQFLRIRVIHSAP